MGADMQFERPECDCPYCKMKRRLQEKYGHQLSAAHERIRTLEAQLDRISRAAAAGEPGALLKSDHWLWTQAYQDVMGLRQRLDESHRRMADYVRKVSEERTDIT